MNIPSNVYNIHIDDHLEVIGAQFTSHCTQIHRIVVNETSTSLPPASQLPVGYIDTIEGRACIVVPADFPTIQDGINAASPGDVVFASKNRTYFENVIIRNNVWLIGEDVNTTIIDGRFADTEPTRISVEDCSNVTIYALTIRLSAEGGAQVYLRASNSTISSNMILSGLGDGIHVIGSGNTVSGNVIRLNSQCGIRVEGSDSTITSNIIESSDECGIRIQGSNSIVSDNKITSSLETGIYIDSSGSAVTGNITDNIIEASFNKGISIVGGSHCLVRNNTIKNNGIGLNFDKDTSYGTIYQNRFVGNSWQALDNGTANVWDNGYPYSTTSLLWKPFDNQTGGGNYWSDFVCSDIYSGPDQNAHALCCLPSPDGICDKPYDIQPNSTDHYPLFLIQKIAQDPRIDQTDCSLNATLGRIDYNTKVNLTATMLKYVQVTNASIYVDYNGSKHDIISMKIFGENLTGTIPNQPYGTTVRYNISALAYNATWLNSTSYPIPFPYRVLDWTSPNITRVDWRPVSPNENQTIAVYAIVTEPLGASQVDRVCLSYQVENTTWWTADMTRLADDNYTAVIQKQPGKTELNFTVIAFDKAGNNATKPYPPVNVDVRKLPELSVVYRNRTDDPSSIDLGVVSGDQTVIETFTIRNLGDETLGWAIETVKGGSWLKSISSASGALVGGQGKAVNVTIDTSYCPDSSLYVGELSVKGNGSVPKWAVIISFTVRYIVIDQSWASFEAPNRCDVGTTQYYAFHAEWAHNCSDTIDGNVTLEGMTQGKKVNSTGWAVFDYSSQVPINKTFRVGKVQFGNITAFQQRAPNRITVWDRVYINLSLALDWIDTESIPDVSWNGSYYGYDKSPFEGRPLFDPPPFHDAVGRYSINASSIVDYKYHLSVFSSNTVWCIWDRIEIIGGGVSRVQTGVGQTERVWFIAAYKYENMLFKGGNGTLFVNGEPMVWSSDKEVWEKDFAFTTEGTRTFVVTKVEDDVHNLTRVHDNVGPLSVTWGGVIWPTSRWWEFWSPTDVNAEHAGGDSSWVLLIVVLTLGIGLSATLLVLMKSGKKSKPSGDEKGKSGSVS
jgi:parallel beta-helix repeat protein